MSSPVPPTNRPTDLGAALVTKPVYPSLTYGIQAFIWWNPTIRALDLEHVRLMRFSHVKQIFAWGAIQPDPKLPYDWSKADAVVDEIAYRGLKLIARVDQAPGWAVLPAESNKPPLNVDAWGQFCHDLAARYKGRIAGYQILNEPNLTREWFSQKPNPAAYVELLKRCFTSMKAADPNAVIISAGLAPTGDMSDAAIRDDVFLLGMYKAGFAPYYDVLGLNAPGYKSPPEIDPGDAALNGQRWQAFRHVEDMRAIQVSQGDGGKQVAILEMGWTLDKIHPDYAWFAVSEAQQAQYLVGAYRYAALNWQPWMGLMTTIYLPDPNWTEQDEQYWWAIATPGYNPVMRKAFIELSNMERWSGDQHLPPQLAGEPQHTALPPEQK